MSDFNFLQWSGKSINLHQSLNAPGYKKLLYHALLYHACYIILFDAYPPLAAAEYMKSDHTNGFVDLFLGQVQKSILGLVNLLPNMKPKLITTDFSLAIISGLLKEYNRQNIKEYLEKCFELIIVKERMPSDITVVSVCSVKRYKVLH